MGNKGKKESRFYNGYLILSGIVLLIALYITIMFATGLPHDLDITIVLIYVSLYLPAVVLALMGFFKFKAGKRTAAFVVLGAVSVIFAVSVYFMPTVIAEKGFTDPERYKDAVRAMEHYNEMGRTFKLALPEDLPDSAYDKKLHFNINFNDRPLILNVEYKLPQDEYNKTVDNWTELYKNKEIVETNGEKSIVVYENEDSFITRAVLFFWNDSSCKVRMLVFDGDPMYFDFDGEGINVG